MQEAIAYPQQAPVHASPPDGWGAPRLARWLILLTILEYTMQGQKQAQRPRNESEVHSRKRVVWANIQVPQALKHPQKETDHPRLPLELRGKFLGFVWVGMVWAGICIPCFSCMNPSVPSYMGENREEQTLGWMYTAIGHNYTGRHWSKRGIFGVRWRKALDVVRLLLKHSLTRTRPFRCSGRAVPSRSIGRELEKIRDHTYIIRS